VANSPFSLSAYPARFATVGGMTRYDFIAYLFFGLLLALIIFVFYFGISV